MERKKNMKKQLISLGMIICILLSLSSCTKNYSLKNTFDQEALEYEEFTKSQYVSMLDGMNHYSTASIYAINSNNNLSVFKTADSKYTVYNVGQNKIVKAFEKVEKISLQSVSNINGEMFNIIMVNTQDGKTDIYDFTGEYIGSSEENINYLISYYGFFEFDQKIYRINDDGTVDPVGNSASLPTTTSFTDYANGYYYIVKNSSVHVYDSNLNLTATWEKSSSNDSCSICILENGNVIIQTRHSVPQDAKKYTYYSGTTKYSLTSYILNPKNGKTRTVNLDYVISSVDNNTSGYYAKGIRNVGAIYPIENKMLLDNKHTYVSLTNNGQIDGYLFTELKDHSSPDYISLINKEVIIYKSTSGSAYFVNLKGKILHMAKSYDSYLESLGYTGYINQHYVVVDEIIYDWNFNAKYNLAKNDMKVTLSTANSIILESTKDNSYYRYDKDGNMTKIGEMSNVILEHEYYVVNNSGRYAVYNYSGQKITTFANEPKHLMSSGNSVLVSVKENNQTKHYLLTK